MSAVDFGATLGRLVPGTDEPGGEIMDRWRWLLAVGSLGLHAPSAAQNDSVPPGTPPAPPVVTAEVKEERTEPTGSSWATPRSVTSMMQLTLRPLSTSDIGSRKQRVGGYTRLVMEPAEPTSGSAQVRDYENAKRNWLRRMFFGKAIARILTVKTNVSRPRTSTTATVASLGYESNSRTGESWNSELNGRRVLTPLFRIDADGSVGIEADLTVSSNYKAAIASEVVNLVSRASALVAPTSTLLTSANRERFSQASQFVDQSINGMMAESILERTASEFPLHEWAGQPLATINLWLPVGNEVTPTSRMKPEQRIQRIGSWTVKSTEPVISVFADTPMEIGETATSERCRGKQDIARAACHALSRVSPEQIMSFQVDQNLTVAQVLAGDGAIGAARDAMVDKGDGQTGGAGRTRASAPIDEAVRTLCLLVVERAQALGFNRYDSAAILWAFANQSLVTNDAEKLRNQRVCTPMRTAYDIGLIETT